jgi:hypothetical protein
MTSIDTWQTISFNVQGIDTLCHCFGIMPAVYCEFKGRFHAAELVWLFSGASEDGMHFQLPTY